MISAAAQADKTWANTVAGRITKATDDQALEWGQDFTDKMAYSGSDAGDRLVAATTAAAVRVAWFNAPNSAGTSAQQRTNFVREAMVRHEIGIIGSGAGAPLVNLLAATGYQAMHSKSMTNYGSEACQAHIGLVFTDSIRANTPKDAQVHTDAVNVISQYNGFVNQNDMTNAEKVVDDFLVAQGGDQTPQSS